MKQKIVLSSILICITAAFILISMGIDSFFLTKAVRWTEIIIVLSFFAGLVKFLGKEFYSAKRSFREFRDSFASQKTSVIKELRTNVLFPGENVRKAKLPGKDSGQIRGMRYEIFNKMVNSLTIIISATATFTLGFINPNQSRYTFENIVREQPDFLTETALVFIENDIRLSKYPSKKKLALYISSEVSTDFFPTEEMLKNADISLKNYKKLISENKILPPLADDMSEAETEFINNNDMMHVREIKEKVKSASVGIIADMFPIAQELREWFDRSVSSLTADELKYTLETGKKNRFDDFVYAGTRVEESGKVLEEWIRQEKENLRKKSGKLNRDMFRYNNFLTGGGTEKENLSAGSRIEKNIAETAAEKLAGLGSSTLPPESKKRIAAKFLKTGITTSPEIKGFIRWIYRYIFDPLLSSFVALLLLNMISTVYTRFSIKSYSYCIITIAFVATLAGLTNQYGFFAQNNLPEWNGPLSPGWLMSIIAVPALRALAIGTATGLLFFIAENFYTTFFKGSGVRK